MTDQEIHEQAEAHWRYTEKIILAMLEVAHIQSVESFIHGAKHEAERRANEQRTN